MPPQHLRTASGMGLGFALLCLAALVGFWQPYLVRLGAPATPWLHLHAASVGAWLLLLVLQPVLAATGRLGLHRRLGGLAWGLAPVIAITSLALAVVMTRPRGDAGLEDFRYALFFVQLTSALLFSLSAGLALAWRRERALHMRLMLCSGLFFIDPVFARVFGHWTPDAELLVAYGSVMISVMAFGLLAWADRQAPRGRWALPAFGALNLAMHATALGIHRWQPWRGLMQAWFS